MASFPKLLRNVSPVNLQSIYPNLSLFYRSFSRSCSCYGVEEFFPVDALDSGQPIEEEVKVGRRWKIHELRQKSFPDLHKLWYVLLKEKNMLLTVEEEARRLNLPMPGPTRLHKDCYSVIVNASGLPLKNRTVPLVQEQGKDYFIVGESMDCIKNVIKEREKALTEMEAARYDFDDESDSPFPISTTHTYNTIETFKASKKRQGNQ